jgi:hypothetical protein
MSYKVLDFDELQQDLLEHQEKVMFDSMDEAIKDDLVGMGADSMKRSGRLVTLHWKGGELDVIKKELGAKMSKHKGKLKHVGVRKNGDLITAEVELN